MADYKSGYILTDKGKALQAKVEAGTTTLKLTKMEIGSGTVSSLDEYRTRTSLISVRAGMIPSDVSSNGSMCQVTATLSSETIEEGFDANELGLYATDDGNEILYCVSYDENPSYVPGKYDGAATKTEFSLLIAFSDAAKIELTLPTDSQGVLELIQNAEVSAAKAATNAENSQSLAEAAADRAEKSAQAVSLSATAAKASETASNKHEKEAQGYASSAENSSDNANRAMQYSVRMAQRITQMAQTVQENTETVVNTADEVAYNAKAAKAAMDNANSAADNASRDATQADQSATLAGNYAKTAGETAVHVNEAVDRLNAKELLCTAEGLFLQLDVKTGHVQIGVKMSEEEGNG